MSWAAKIWPMLRASGDLHELIAQLLVASRGDWAQIPGFVVVSFTTESTVVAIRGELTATFQSAEREYRVGGSHIKTWEEYHLPTLEALWIGSKSGDEDRNHTDAVSLDGYAPMSQLRWSKHKDLSDGDSVVRPMPSELSLTTVDRESRTSRSFGADRPLSVGGRTGVGDHHRVTSQTDGLPVGLDSQSNHVSGGGAPEAELTTGPTSKVRPAEVFGPLALSQSARDAAADLQGNAATKGLGIPAESRVLVEASHGSTSSNRVEQSSTLVGQQAVPASSNDSPSARSISGVATSTASGRSGDLSHEFPRLRRRQGRAGDPAVLSETKTGQENDSVVNPGGARNGSGVAVGPVKPTGAGRSHGDGPAVEVESDSSTKQGSSTGEGKTADHESNILPQELHFSSEDSDRTSSLKPVSLHASVDEPGLHENSTQRLHSPSLAPVDRRRILRPVEGFVDQGPDDDTTALMAHPGQAPDLVSVSGTAGSQNDNSTVLSVLCANGHPNPPRREGCYVCGAPVMGRQQLMPRPSLGVVRVSTGTQYQLDRDILFGRAPSPTDLGRPEPHLVYLDAPEISAMHVMIKVDGWSAVALDRRSTNGTTLIRGGLQPTLLEHGIEFPLQGGDILDLGDGATAMVSELP